MRKKLIFLSCLVLCGCYRHLYVVEYTLDLKLRDNNAIVCIRIPTFEMNHCTIAQITENEIHYTGVFGTSQELQDSGMISRNTKILDIKSIGNISNENR